MIGRKLQSSRGETLVELLASILIAALSVAVLFTCCMASAEMGRETQAADKRFYEALSAAERQQDPGQDAQVSVAADNGTAQTVDVALYGGEDMYSYKVKEAAPGGP